jgi:hypothetical protein
MMAKRSFTLNFVASFLMAGAAVMAIAEAPIAAAESFASVTIPAQQGGSGCTAAGTCGHGGPGGGGGCAPGVGCFQWGQ